jgi:FkbM family methyltransferase
MKKLNINDIILLKNLLFSSFKNNKIPSCFTIETFEELYNKLNLIINYSIFNPQKKNLEIKGEGSYIHLINKHKPNFELKENDIILEIGSRDGLDAIDLYNKFKCNIYAFECNPTAIELMQDNINYHNPNNNNIKIVEYAINDIDNDNLDFYPTIIDNIGASSIYKLIKNSNNQEVREHTNRHVQKHIKVKSIRLDTWIEKYNIDYNKIKLLCLDLQGNELNALKSLSKYINYVNIIICEGQYEKCYNKSCLFDDIYKYLLKYNFICLNMNSNFDKAFSDFIFVKFM